MGCGASAAAPPVTPGGGTAEYNTGGGAQAVASSGPASQGVEMDDEVAQQTAELLFDLLPYYDTGNTEADQIFLATLQAQSMLVHARDPHGNTLLMVACQSVKSDLIELMIEKEVDVNAQNYMGVSALHIVCYEVNDKSYTLCEQLITAGANTDARDAEGCTPVHYAASGGHASLVALLLMYGANAVAVDNMGYTAQDYAVQSNHSEVVQLLYHAAGAEEDPKEEEETLIEVAADLWTEYLDPASGCPYYYNSLTGETTWDRPESFESTIADLAADALRITQQENVEKAQAEYDNRGEGEMKVAFLLERWRRIAWRAGMKGVMDKQRKATRKFAMEQAKARMYLLENGTSDQQASVQKELKMNKAEVEKLKAKLKEKDAQKAVVVNDSEIQRLRAELEKKNRNGNLNMDAIKNKMRKEFEDEFQQQKRQAMKEIESRQAEKASAMAQALAAKDKEVGSMKEKLEMAEKLSKQKLQSADEAAKRQGALKKQNDESARKVAEMQKKLDAKDAQLQKKTKEVDKIRAQSATKESQVAAEAKKLAQEKAQLEKEKAQMSLELQNLKDENAKLRRDYLHEQNLRRKYHNEVEDLKGAIRVYSRTRPLSNSEKEKNCKEVTSFPDEFVINITDENERKKTFEFDKSFGPNSTQEEVFGDTKRLIQSAIDGYNVCIFAYGQTGSGKTYTMMGASNDENPGLTPRAVKEIFRIGRRDKDKIKINCSFYMVELYKDALVDLLSDKDVGDQPKLNIKKDSRGVVYIEGVEKRTNIEDKNELNAAIADGMSRRKTASTKMNSESSRSHLIMSILIEVTNLNTNVNTVGKLTLVDLAGSERVGKTGATNDRLKEAQSINKSLSALGDVISSLTSNQKHIPYRNHKLTMLLSDSLGGNAKTLMFVNASPADYNTAETVNSLQFASRVKKVVNQSTKTIETKEIKELKKQLMVLKAAMKMKK
jgi:hypothetical protein